MRTPTSAQPARPGQARPNRAALGLPGSPDANSLPGEPVKKPATRGLPPQRMRTAAEPGKVPGSARTSTSTDADPPPAKPGQARRRQKEHSPDPAGRRPAVRGTTGGRRPGCARDTGAVEVPRLGVAVLVRPARTGSVPHAAACQACGVATYRRSAEPRPPWAVAAPYARFGGKLGTGFVELFGSAEQNGALRAKKPRAAKKLHHLPAVGPARWADARHTVPGSPMRRL
jgi:hypothetical protein